MMMKQMMIVTSSQTHLINNLFTSFFITPLHLLSISICKGVISSLRFPRHPKTPRKESYLRKYHMFKNPALISLWNFLNLFDSLGKLFYSLEIICFWKIRS